MLIALDGKYEAISGLWQREMADCPQGTDIPMPNPLTWVLRRVQKVRLGRNRKVQEPRPVIGGYTTPTHHSGR